MLISLVLAVTIVFLLFIGWQWHFNDVQKRAELARISKVAEDNNAERAAVRAERVRSVVLPATRQPPSTTKPSELTTRTVPSPASSISLAEMAKPTNENVFADPVPLTESVSGEQLADATALQQRFWQATTWTDKLPFVHDAARVGPLMRNYYEQRHEQDPLGSSAARQAHFKINNTEVLLFTYASARPGGTLDVAMLAQPDGRFLIDWESYVGMGDMAWPDLKKQRPSEPKMMRVFAQRDDYYNYEFSDAKQLLSVHLTSPDGTYFIYGFCNKDSPVGRTLTDLFDASRGRAAVTLRIAYPPSAQSDHCAQIVGIVANRWLLVR